MPVASVKRRNTTSKIKTPSMCVTELHVVPTLGELAGATAVQQ